jgi:hypothetical protein
MIMRAARMAVLLGLLALSVSVTVMQEEIRAGDDSKTRIRGTLPPNFGKIGLSDEQKQQIYRVQAKYGAKIDELEKQIETLKAERTAEYHKVLTPAQRKRLEEIRSGIKDK